MYADTTLGRNIIFKDISVILNYVPKTCNFSSHEVLARISEHLERTGLVCSFF